MATAQPTRGVEVITLSGRLDTATNHDVRAQIEERLAAGVSSFVVDLTTISFIDSAGMAALLGLVRKAREAGGDINLVIASDAATRRIIGLTRFDQVFDIFASTEDALRELGASRAAASEPAVNLPLGERRGQPGLARFELHTEEETIRIGIVSLAGRLDVDASPALRQQVERMVAAGTVRLILDLTAVDFLDSTGIAALLHALRLSRQAGGNVRLVRPRQEAIFRVLRLTRLDHAFAIHGSREDALGGFSPV